ncbi:hypothetical protein ACJX0J_041830, partial [Zea mays]
TTIKHLVEEMAGVKCVSISSLTGAAVLSFEKKRDFGRWTDQALIANIHCQNGETNFFQSRQQYVVPVKKLYTLRITPDKNLSLLGFNSWHFFSTTTHSILYCIFTKIIMLTA